MRSILVSVMMLFYYSLFSQAYLKPRLINFDPATCNNTFVCEFYNFDFPHKPYSNTDLTNTVSYGDTIYNYCYDPDYNYPTAAMTGYSSNGYLSHYLLSSSPVTPDYNYTITSFTSATTESSQDGSILFQFDNIVNFNNVFIEQESGYQPPHNFISANELEITQINKGFLQLFLTHPTDSSKYIYLMYYHGDPDSIYHNTGMNVNISFQHSNSSCTGWINLQSNPDGTYYNVWSDGISNVQTRTDLCPGFYAVYSYDLLGGNYNTGSIDTLIITDDSLTYIDTNLYSITPQDTAYYFDENCSFSFFTPIDSSHYVEDTVYYLPPLLIATFELTLYQGNNVVVISDSLITLADSTVLLDIVIYCNLFKAPFLGHRILFLRGADGNLLNSAHLYPTDSSIIEFEDIFVYPNPSPNMFNVLFKDTSEKTIKLYALNGELILFDRIYEDSYLLDLSNYPSGAYFIIAEGETYQKVAKLIKL